MQTAQKNHKPPHYFSDSEIYFITAGTYQKAHLFDGDTKKAMLKSVIKEKSLEFGIKIIAFVIMDSHYHLLVSAKDSGRIPIFIRSVNGKSAFLLNHMDEAQERKVWYNYWDSCVKEEKDLWARFNYIHHNLVKHGYADKMADYGYSSYSLWIKKKGEEWMLDVLERYPIIDYTKGDE